MSIFHDPAVLMQKARQQLQEKTLTAAETKKKEEIVKSMKGSAADFEKRYPGRGKEVMYATATKQAKKVAEDTEQVDEGMTMKDFKANRKKLQRKEASADAEKRGHEGKEWYNSGRKYGTDEAKSRRANMSDDQRAARHRAAVDPDDDRDENTYSADKTKNPKKLRKQKAMGELGEQHIDEKVGLSIVSAREPKYDRNEHGEVKINPANALRFAGKKLANAAGVKKKIRIRIGEDVEPQVINHLIENGFAETEDSARNILRNMSETWLQSIMERESDEPGESDDRPDVKAHNRAVRYRPRPRRPGPKLGRDYGGGSDDDRPPLRGFPRG